MKRIKADEYMKQRPSKEFLAHYVTFRPNVLDSILCDKLIKMYDDHPELHIQQQQAHFKFNQFDLTANRNKLNDRFDILHAHVVGAAQRGMKQYVKDVDSEFQIPIEFGYEHFRINRTDNNGKDGFGEHTDVFNYESARRYITALFYLNDIKEGGDAAFPTLGFSVKPAKGSMLCFPSNWLYLHCGLKPISDPKYIMTTFAHYL